MRLWTIQPKSWYDTLCRKGVIHCDEEIAGLTGDDFFSESYLWMAEQMAKRIGPPPEGVRFPIWAWHTHEWMRQRPVLDKEAAEGYGEAPVCIEIEVPENQVLLSDEESWYFVLNDIYNPNAFNEKEYDEGMAAFDALDPDAALLAKRKSWELVFDVSPYKSEWMDRGRYIQACFWELRLEQVVAVYPAY